MKRKVLIGLLVLAVSLAITVNLSQKSQETRRQAASSENDNLINAEIDWIKSLQQKSGAILMKNRESKDLWMDKSCYKIEPYFASIAAEEVLGETAKKYATWYLSKITERGTINIYYADSADNKEYDSGGKDSEDSYAATFISMLREYYESSGDKTFFTDNKDKIRNVIGVMLELQDSSDSLSVVMKNDTRKFAMDNAEVFDGLKDAALIEKNVFGDTTQSDLLKSSACKLKKSFESNLWNSTNKNYNWELKGTSDLTNFYPPMMAQIYPYIYAVNTDINRAKAVKSGLDKNFSEWTSLKNTTEFSWMQLAYFSLLVGDTTSSEKMIASAKTQYLDTGRKWKWFVGEGAYLIKTLRQDKDQFQDEDVCLVIDHSECKFRCEQIKTNYIGPNKWGGDYNCDGALTGGDFSVWRDEAIDKEFVGTRVESDGTCDGRSTVADYARWREEFLKQI